MSSSKAEVDVVVNGALTLKAEQEWWTERQRGALASIGLSETPDGDLMAFMHLCQATGLDPFRREVYLIGRKDRKAPGGMKWTAQTGIDGFRHIAERTGLYGGKVTTEWCGPDGEWKDVWLSSEPPAAARVGIARTDLQHLVYGTAIYTEFVPMQDVWENNQKTGKQVPGGLWGKMPAHMLAKCAEALAIRTAFPRHAGGLYITEEMHQADAQAEREERDEQAAMRARARAVGLEVAGSSIGSRRRKPAAEDRALVIVDQSGKVLSDEAEPDATAEPERVDVEPEPVDREALLAELAEQAKAFGMTIPAFTRRWALSRKKNVQDATDEELLDLVSSRRDVVAEAKAKQVAEQVSDAPTATEPDREPEPDPDVDKPDDETAEDEPTAAARPVPSDGHRYAENEKAKDGSCLACGEQWDDHPEADGDGPDEPLVPDL